MSEPAAANAFDFGEVIAAALADYLPRPIVEEEVLSYVGQNRAGCCVIIGEPGSGKTSLAAALIHTHGYFHHFLRSGHTEFSVWSDPHAFLTSLSFMLKSKFGDSIFPETAVIDVQGHIRDVPETGSLVVTEIQQLVAIPWHSATLNVSLTAEKIRGTATGVRIQQVVEDYRRLPLSAFREMALSDPLRRLRQLRPDERVVLWVDGLDEVAESRLDGSPSGQGIASVLPLPVELTELGNLLLVISSRPSPVLDRFWEDGAHVIDLGDARFEKDNSGLVERYVDRELAQETVKPRIAEAKKEAGEIRQAVIDACDYNLLYLRHFFIALRSGQLNELLASGIPKGLDAIYARLISRVARSTGARYLTDYHPLVCALAVAVRGLSAEQIRCFSGLDKNQVNEGVATLRPFLDVERIERGNTYGFYHRSFRETLVSDNHRDETWYVDPETSHGRVAQFYLKEWETGPEAIDDYGFLYLTYHLARSGRDLQRSLFSLLGEPWRQAKRKHFGSNLSFAADLATAAVSARNLPFPDGLIETAALALMDTMLVDVAGKLPEGALELLVRLGQTQRALNYVQSGLHPVQMITYYSDLVRGFTAIGDNGRDLLYTVLEQGLEICAAHPDQSHGLLASLLQACMPDSSPRMDELLRRAVQLFNVSERPYWETPRALIEIARLLTALDRASADNGFRQALQAVSQYAHDNPYILSEVFRYWSEYDPDAASDALARQPLEAGSESSVETVLNVSRAAAARSGNGAALEHAYAVLTQEFLPKIGDPFRRAWALTAMAGAELEIGERLRASETMGKVLALIQQIGGTDDPERNLQNRLSQATTALINAAQMDLQVDANRGQSTLCHAWSSLREHGFWQAGVTLATLVRTQFHLSRDLLEIQIAKISDSEIKSDLLAAAAREMLIAEEESAAAALMENALMLREKPQSRTSGRAELCLGIARTLDLNKRDAAQMLLDQAGLAYEVIIAWRQEVLRHLIQNDDPAASAWLTETVRRWDQPNFNANYICELPGMVKEMPLPLVTDLRQSIERLISPTQKRLMEAAVGARLKKLDTVADDTLLRIVLDGLDANDSRAIIPPHRILAFTAGQWWDVDRGQAERLLQDALLRLETDTIYANNRRTRNIQLMYIVEDVLIGAPEAALPILLAYEEPPPAPNELLFRVPGPGSSAHLSAGIRDRDYLLAIALGRMACYSEDTRDRLLMLTNPVVLGLAASTAARLAEDVRPDIRLVWCEAAQQSAYQLGEHYLQSLFAADAAEAFCEIGAKRKATELAQATAKTIVEEGSFYESIFRQPAYTHALGKCIRVIANAAGNGGYPDSVTLLWEARRLGIGLHTVIGYVASIVARAGGSAHQLLLDAEKRGTNLFS